MRSTVVTILCLGIVCLVPAIRGDEEKAPQNPYAQTLVREGVKITKAGIQAYLAAQDPANAQTPEYLARVAAWIVQLGDRSWKKREAATRALVRLPIPPLGELREAAKSDNLEVATRARQILVAAQSQGATQGVVTHAVFHTIRLTKIKGLARGILGLIPQLQERYVLIAARDALVATVEKSDAELLRKALTGRSIEARIAALVALGALLGPGVLPELQTQANDKNPRIRLAAGRAMAEQGDRQALGLLAALLSDESLRIRLGAIRYLRALSGKKFGFLAYESPSKRKLVVSKWAAWVAGAGAKAKLNHPLKPVEVMLGRTLVCLYSKNKVVEYDSNGEKVWEKTIPGAMCAVGLPNGHRVIGSYNGKFIVEYDAKGDEVWRKSNLPGNLYNIQRLVNGNTLVACYSTKKVLEIQPDGKTAWSATVAGNPISAQRLANGRTLIALYSQSKVVEIDQAGKEVWSLTGKSNPIQAVRLQNGNTLVCEMGKRRVVEYDRKGKMVWEKTGLSSPRSAQRLKDGTTLISGGRGAIIVDRAGKVIWEKKLSNAGTSYRY